LREDKVVPVLEKLPVVTLSELRKRLPEFRRKVQRGETLAVEYYKSVVGYLLPISIAETLEISASEDMRLIDFRDGMNQAWERVDQEVIDCIWLTYHDRRVMAFVSTRLWKEGETPE
jgi:hypothetical protein